MGSMAQSPRGRRKRAPSSHVISTWRACLDWMGAGGQSVCQSVSQSPGHDEHTSPTHPSVGSYLRLMRLDGHDVGAQRHNEVLVELLAERAGHLLDVPEVDQVAVVPALCVWGNPGVPVSHLEGEGGKEGEG